MFTMDEVAGSVGIAKGTIYGHFPSRTDLILSVLEASGARCASQLTTHLAAEAFVAALRGYTRDALAEATTQAAAGDRWQLSYPCCLHQTQCPYPQQDTLRQLMVAALDRGRDEGLLRGAWWDATALAVCIRALLGTFLPRVWTEQLPTMENELDLLVQFLSEALHAGWSTAPTADALTPPGSASQP
ncbi:MAG: Bacterial regulatory protein tetR family [Chloroflexota bacterium]|nr:Bacterial regulatory protein tetR family [Chloroflexota bacterium]